jgi:hypothetical protein
MLRVVMSIITFSFLYSAAYAEEKVTLSSGKEIQINSDGTWSYTSLGELQDSGIIDVDFFDYRVDPESYVGKTISLFGEASFDEYPGREVRGQVYAEYLTLGPSIQIETDGISKEQLTNVYKCFVSCKKKFIGKVVLNTEYSASGFAQFNLIRISD